MIRLVDISIGFSNKKILDRFSYSFSTTKIYAVRGHIGSGKTTLLKALSGQCPYRGKILLGTKKVSKKQLRQHSSFSLTYERLLPDYCDSTIAELFENLKVFSIFDEKVFAQLIATFGIADSKKTLIKSLSEGEKTRLITALTLSKNASVYLLDEPLSSLDRKNADIVKTTLLDFSKSHLIIYSTHDETAVASSEETIDFDNLRSNDVVAEGDINVPAIAKEKVACFNFFGIKKNAFSFLSALAVVASAALGALFTGYAPTVANYIFTPSFVADSLDDKLVFQRQYNSSYHSWLESLKTENTASYPIFFPDTIEYRESKIPTENIFPSYLKVSVIPDTLFEVKVPEGGFYITSTLKNYLTTSVQFNKYGMSTDFIGKIHLSTLVYSGIVESPSLSFVARSQDVFALSNYGDRPINQSLAADAILYDRNGKIYTDRLQKNQVAVYSSDGKLTDYYSYGDNKYDIVAYYKVQLKQEVIFSGEEDLTAVFFNKHRNNNYVAGQNNFYVSLDKNTIADEKKELCSSLQEEIVLGYKESISAPFFTGLITLLTSAVVYFAYLAVFIIIVMKKNRGKTFFLINNGYAGKTVLSTFFLSAVVTEILASSLYYLLSFTLFGQAYLLSSLFPVLLLTVFSFGIVIILINALTPRYPLLKRV